MVQHTLSMVHQYEKGVVYHSFFVLIRVWGNEESLQDAHEALIWNRSVHLAPRIAKAMRGFHVLLPAPIRVYVEPSTYTLFLSYHTGVHPKTGLRAFFI